jgi:hypothetical protein
MRGMKSLLVSTPPALMIVASLALALLVHLQCGVSNRAGSDLLQIAWVVEQLNNRAPDSNLCAGGLENGKRIVAEPYLRDPFQETTRLACEVDGGNPLKVPDLPAPDDRATRLA